ncbi:MAG: TonB-dependent receptor [Phocaeicola sp.]|uniref:TonB-dependent receptor n=1 Tax=Phocaeicola sp. TaxID=2773926 RepID=UPI003F9F0319
MYNFKSKICIRSAEEKQFLRKMKLSALFLFLGMSICFASNTYSQETLMSITANGQTVKEVFSMIEQNSEYIIFYMDNTVDLNRKVKINVKKQQIEKVLDKLFEGTDTAYAINDRQIIIYRNETFPEIKKVTKVEQTYKISGKVVDSKGEPIIGANILEKGTTNGTITDMDGNFTLNVKSSSAILTVSYIGYKAKDVNVTSGKVISVILNEDSEALDEVVVVGYGTQKKVNLTGAVDKVSSSAIEAVKFNNMGEALQGQIPNLNVGIADGKPGRNASFTIRGTASINGGAPLIVIDGVPSTESDLNNLAPQDVDEISVLKDAASSAIYGARAAYGVILVTTKRAKSGDFSINYTNNFGWGKATWLPDVYDNAEDYLDIQEKEFTANIGQTYFTEAQLNYAHQVIQDPALPQAQVQMIGGKSTLLLGGKVHNYYKEWFRTFSPKQNHHISLSGGSGKITYFVAGDFNHEEGSLKFKHENVNRNSLRSNITYELNRHVKFYNNILIVKKKEDLPNMYLYNFCSNVWRFIENTNPMMPEQVEIDGKKVNTDIGFYRQFLTNQSQLKKHGHNLSTTLGLDISLLKNNELRIHADYTYKYSNLDYYRWWDNKGPYLSHNFNNRNIILNYYSDAGPAKVIRANTNIKSWNVNAYATYEKTLRGHHMTFMGGFNRESYDMLYQYAEHQNPIEGISQHALNLGTGDYKNSDNDDRNLSQSTFFRANYDYMSKYLLEMNGCYNQSSKFADDNRGAFFASFSGGWRISEERFFEPLKKVFNNLKVRMSYGALGNQNIGSYDYLSLYTFALSGFTIDGQQVTYTSSPNPKSQKFTWERSKTIDFGFDAVLFNNRLNLTFDVYQRDTKNMLAKFHSLPSVFGATVPHENSASLRNRGWELSIGWNDKFVTKYGDFNYGAKFSLSDYKAEITNYYNDSQYLGDYYKGMKIGEIWGLHTLGFFQTDEEAKNGALLETSGYKSFASAGNLKFEDINNDGKISKGAWTLKEHGDFSIIGNSTPRYQFGFTLFTSYRGFDLNAFFKGVGKRDVYPAVESTNFWGSYNRKYQILLRHVVENRWTPEHTDAYFPKPQGYIAGSTNNDLGVPQTRYLQNASYLRLKSLVLGYTIPNSLLKKVRIDNLRIYVSAQNLFKITKLNNSLDPEGLEIDPDGYSNNLGMGTSYPIQRTFAFGIELKL